VQKEIIKKISAAFEAENAGERRAIVSVVEGARTGELAVPGGESQREPEIVRLGSILQSQGKLTPEEIERIQAFQSERGLRFGSAAIELGLVRDEDVHQALARQFDYPYLPSGDNQIAAEVIAAHSPFDPKTEPFRALRAQLVMRWLEARDRGRALAIVGPGRGEGRSYVAANLAITFSQLGERTLLIDGDMRFPLLHELFNVDNRTGLSSILAGRGEKQSIHQINPFTHLSLITAGPLPPNPQELLARPYLHQLLAELSKEFKIIIIDTPAGSAAADVQLICSAARSALFVTRRNETRVKTAARLLEELGPAGVSVVGSVLNDF
jgi:protein-tyrosine kinase